MILFNMSTKLKFTSYSLFSIFFPSDMINMTVLVKLMKNNNNTCHIRVGTCKDLCGTVSLHNIERSVTLPTIFFLTES